MGWLILALMGAVTFLYGLSVHATLLCLLVKPLPVLALLGWLHDAPPSDYRRWISLGLIFSLLGDVLLAWPGDLFVFGLGAFLVAHLAYLKAYLSDCRRLAVVPLILALGVGAVLLGFAEKNPGMTRVLIGDALVNEDERLQARINQLVDRLEAALRQALRIAQAAGAWTGEPGADANLLTAFVVGRWQLFAKSGFKRSPQDGWEAQRAYLFR